MDYRQLGRTGLKVSAFTLGSMEFGGKTDARDARRLFDMALERGINVIDTANVYTSGASEELVGELIRPHRSRVLLATKFGVPVDGADPNSGGMSRHAVIEGCEASLRRLGTDHIDIFYIHRPFQNVAIEETLRALDDLMSAGKVRAIGSSSFASWQLVEAQWCSDIRNLVRIGAEQTPYHLLDRRVERELVPAALSHGVGLTIWSPLAGGLLTGKYRGGAGESARLQPDNDWGAKHFTPEAAGAVEALAALAEAAGVSLTALSLAWTLSRPAVSSIVLGPRNTTQLEDALAALEVTLDAALLAETDAIVPFGRAVVPYYLDDAFADFAPSLHHW